MIILNEVLSLNAQEFWNAATSLPVIASSMKS